MKFKISVDDDFGIEILNRAYDLGCNLQSYLLCILKSTKINRLDLAMLEESGIISLDAFKNQLLN